MEKLEGKFSGHAGFGLRGISERVKILGGSFGMHSAPEAGTKLTVEIPIESKGRSGEWETGRTGDGAKH